MKSKKLYYVIAGVAALALIGGIVYVSSKSNRYADKKKQRNIVVENKK